MKEGDKVYQNCCKKCGSIDLFAKQSGNNTGLYCYDCGAWIKWLSKNEIRAFEQGRKETVQSKELGSEDIQCAACGFIGRENGFFNNAVHNKFKICPKCGTIRFVCDENRLFRKEGAEYSN